MLNSKYLTIYFFIQFLLRILKRAEGIEPSSLAWKAKVLPLNYARFLVPTLYFIIIFQKITIFYKPSNGTDKKFARFTASSSILDKRSGSPTLVTGICL